MCLSWGSPVSPPHLRGFTHLGKFCEFFLRPSHDPSRSEPCGWSEVNSWADMVPVVPLQEPPELLLVVPPYDFNQAAPFLSYFGIIWNVFCFFYFCTMSEAVKRPAVPAWPHTDGLHFTRRDSADLKTLTFMMETGLTSGSLGSSS